MDIATFSGPCTPVLGMLLLGAALSRLSLKSLPKGFWKSAALMAVFKLVIGKTFSPLLEGGEMGLEKKVELKMGGGKGPVIGIVWTTQLRNYTTWIDSEDEILVFTMIISSAGKIIALPPRRFMIWLSFFFPSLHEQFQRLPLRYT